MDELAVDLTLYLWDGRTCAALVSIVERDAKPSMPGSEQGVLSCRLELIIHGQMPKPGDLISVPFTRKTDPLLRAKSSRNYWNMLPLEKGDRLVLVLQPTTDKSKFKALSGHQASGPEDPAVTGLKECYRIMGLNQGSEPQRQALAAALISANPLLKHFAKEAICRHDYQPREPSCDLFIKALDHADLAPEDRIRYSDCLASAPIFDEAQSDDSVNRKAVTAMAAQTARLTKAEDRKTIVRYLASCIFQDFSDDEAKNRRVRKSLLQAIGKTPPQPIAEALAAMAKSTIDDDHEIAKELLDEWAEAGK